MATCEVCNDEFEAKRSDARYCSAGCRKRASRDTVNDALPIPDTASADTDDRRRAAAMKAEADRLTELQREHRGWVPGPVIEGKPSLVLGPYVPTPESEARAAEIGHLRKTAARLLYPTAKGTHAHR